MCIIHEISLHYIFQNLMIAFEQSKTLSTLFMRRVGCLLCTCQKDLYFDSKNIIGTQRTLYEWFEETCKSNQRLVVFKPIVDEFKQNGSIDSGTKITFLSLLKDINSLNFYKLRSITENYETNQNNIKKQIKKNIFFSKLLKLKFDLKICSAKEFIELLNKIDNCAIKYIQLTTKSKITLRDLDHLTIRNFMGEVEATIESKYEKNLKNSEFYLKRLADAVHYRLAKQIPSSDTIVGSCSMNNFKILLQSPPESSFSESNESSLDLTTSYYTNHSGKNTDCKTSDNLTSSISHVELSSADFSKNISSSLSSNTLNGSSDSSILSNNSSEISSPLTSSPMSTSSSPKNFKISDTKTKKHYYKKKNTQKNNINDNNNKIPQKEVKDQLKNNTSTNSSFSKHLNKENKTKKQQQKSQNTSIKSNQSFKQQNQQKSINVCQ